MGIQFITQFDRLTRMPLDSYSVFENMHAFEDYLANKPAFTGQIVAVGSPPEVYVVYQAGGAYTFRSIGSGGFDINTDKITINDPFIF